MMHYSYILCLVLMANLSLSAASSGRNPNDHQRSSYDEVPGHEIVNIGNGVNRKNTVIIDERPDNVGAPYKITRSRSQPDPLGYRFGDDATNNFNEPYSERKHDKNSRPWKSTTNIGNGYNNRNTVIIGNLDRETSFSEQANPNVGNTGGTSFVRNHNNGFETYHVGYGTNNQNKIYTESKPLEPGSNVGNGFTSNNRDVTVNNDQSTNIPEDSNSNDFNSAGTSFVHNKNNRMDLFNIGYGSSNQNKVVNSDTPAQTENAGNQPASSSVVENHLKNLHRLSEKLQEIVNQLIIQLEEQ